MKFIVDLFVAIPIGILYNLMVLKLGEITNVNVPYKIKMQRNLLLAFGCAAFAFFLAQTVFNNNKQFENRAVKYGLWIGMIMLLIHVMLYNWKILENDSKLIILIMTFAILVIYSYNYSDKDNQIENDDDDDY